MPSSFEKSLPITDRAGVNARTAPVAKSRLRLAIEATHTTLKPIRPAILACLYAVALCGCLWLSYEIRFDFNIPPEYRRQMFFIFSWVVPLKILLLLFFGQFKGMLSYFSTPDIRPLFASLAISSLAVGIARYQCGVEFAPPRGIIVADFFLSFVCLSAGRLVLRQLRERLLTPRRKSHRRTRKIGIIGAGDVGASLVRELFAKRWLALQPVAFFDDNQSTNSRVHGIPVVGKPELLLNPRLDLKIEEVVIAMPSAPAKRIREIVQILQQAHIPFQTVPSLEQLATGKVQVSHLRPVAIQDLLGRQQVDLETENIRALLKDRVVMVTGAGGSIGSELCRQIASFVPRRLLLVERSEVQIFPIEQQLADLGYNGSITPLVANVLDTPRMRGIFETYQPDVIFHAAAHKHVPLMESQPAEAIQNNTVGTMKMAELALEFGVERFVLISTDKAINPTSVMGVTKRLAEILIQSLHAANPGRTKFMAVRFGNVLNSSGSVIPIFKKQIAAGGPVTVTHPEVTRYFMTIPEASGLVLQSAAQGTGGEIFVLDMGSPIKIITLARQLIELSGLRPEQDIEIKILGLRPGEKLYEEIAHIGENVAATTHPKIMRFVAPPQPLERVRQLVSELTFALYDGTADELKLMLKNIVPEYQPYLLRPVVKAENATMPDASTRPASTTHGVAPPLLTPSLPHARWGSLDS